MAAEHDDLSRRAVFKQAAVGGVGLVAGSVLTGAGGDQASAAVEQVAAKDEWLAERASFLSGNRLLKTSGDGSMPPRTLARGIYRPRSSQEIADLIRSLPAKTPVASVCGGHESSNAAMFASSEAIVLDMVHLTSIEFRKDGDRVLVTVGAGVVFRELVEAVKLQHGALPVGTGPGVGVVGYIVNGGLSGYFSRRLGLLGQCVESLTVVTAAGDIRVLAPGEELFTAMLGAGSALGIVVDVTLRMEPESVVKHAEQRVVSFRTRKEAVEFARGALRIQREHVLPDDSVSMEVVVSGAKVVVVTFVFYDTFRGSVADFVTPLEELAARLNLPVAMASHWSSWYQTAAALWPVITAMKGSPLAMLQHCLGTEGPPDDRILDFICNTVIARAPLDEATFSIVEIRTLGGAAASQGKIPSGNCHHQFFVDLITLYDAKNKTVEERQAIADLTTRIIDEARHVDGLAVDFSGTHSQPDDVGLAPSPPMIFGTEAMAKTVQRLKKNVDPENRFRFHPFAKFL
ncbi:MAG: FAD-binding oxidoreductase [Planctomycetota bacterium]|nr:MAG: FAD-binding oxidoreductase [Planctomycetota bacterium]